jgi:hypothetical protein
MLKEKLKSEVNMSTLAIILISALGGGLVTGGTIWAVQSKHDKANQQNITEVLEAVKGLETEFEKAQADAVVNLTEPDLLQIPCSAEFIEKQDPNALLCKEMFCRMNRQGGGQNSGGGAGATEQDCSAISGVSVNLLKVQTCMEYWNISGENDQNSQYSRCVNQFSAKP